MEAEDELLKDKVGRGLLTCEGAETLEDCEFVYEGQRGRLLYRVQQDREGLVVGLEGLEVLKWWVWEEEEIWN